MVELDGAAGNGFSQPHEEHGTPVALTFAVTDLPAVRQLIESRAQDAGLPRDRRQDIVLAVDEIASNAIRHGGGSGRLEVWLAADQLWFRVSDDGRGFAAGPEPSLPDARQTNGRGLWIATRVADTLAVNTGPSGTVVTGAFSIPA